MNKAGRTRQLAKSGWISKARRNSPASKVKEFLQQAPQKTRGKNDKIVGTTKSLQAVPEVFLLTWPRSTIVTVMRSFKFPTQTIVSRKAHYRKRRRGGTFP